MPTMTSAAALAEYAPLTWNADQTAFHTSLTLEDAFHKASCLAGGWYCRPVVIWMWTDEARKEHYIMAPEGAQPQADVSRPGSHLQGRGAGPLMDTPIIDACPLCGTVAALSDATVHGMTSDEPVCDACRQYAIDMVRGPQSAAEKRGDA